MSSRAIRFRLSLRLPWQQGIERLFIQTKFTQHTLDNVK